MKQFVFRAGNEDAFSDGLREVQQACSRKAPSAMLIHIYCGPTDMGLVEERAGRLMETFPEAVLVGLTSGGELMEGHLIEQDILVSVILFAGSKVSLLVQESILGVEAEAGRQIVKEAESIEELKAVEVLFPGADMDSISLLKEISTLPRKIRIFGCYPVGHKQTDPVILGWGSGFSGDAVLAVFYSGSDLHLDTGKSVGWEKLGPPFMVTKAEGHRLMEINGAPALEIYKKYLRVTPEGDFFRDTVEFPLLIKVGEEEILRHAYGFDREGALLLAGNIEEGVEVYLTYGNPSGIYECVNERCAALRAFEPEVILLYSCGARRLFWGQMIDLELAPFSMLASCAGFCTGGELMRDGQSGKIFEHNITLLSIGMREGEKKGLALPEAKVDDSMLRGQVYLLKRLAHLVRSANEDLRRMNEKLKYIAETDELTGLYNRRRTQEGIQGALRGTKSGVSLIMVDVDHFKRVNDSFGHDVGDLVLKGVADILKESAGEFPKAMAGRWGGEEFFLVLPEKDLKEAAGIAETVRERIERHDFGKVKALTASFGVVFGSGEKHYEELLRRCDEALYDSKENGRNRVTVKEEASKPEGSR